MEGLITSWILAPAALLFVCSGLALLIEGAVRVALPWTLRPALGAAVMIVLAQLGTLSAATAPRTLPAIAVLGAAGWLLGALRGVLGGDRRGLGWGLGAGAVVYGLYALPFFVHGEATWAGYIKLDDTATFMAMADWSFQHGRGVPETALGSYTVTIQDNLGIGYPIGSFVGAALMGWLPGQDIAWTIQPGMAFAAASLAMVLFELGRTVIRRPALAAAVAVTATLSALLIGYYLWGGVKELAAAPLITLGPAIAAVAVFWRAGVLLGIAGAGLAGALGLGAGIWIGPVYLLLGLSAWHRRGGGEALRLAAATSGVGILLALPAIFTPAGFYNPLQGGLTADTEMGNLAVPVSPFQVAGVWPALDFRQDPASPVLILLLSVVLCVAVAGIVKRSWRTFEERAGGIGEGAVAALVLGGLLAAMITILVGSPWVDAKALATYSPIFLFAGLCGLVTFAESTYSPPMRAALCVFAAAVVATVAWGAGLAYLGISFAPRAHYEELGEIGERFAGQGPALSTEVSISGPRHFLRELDANAAGGRRAFHVLTRDHQPHPNGTYLDISEIRPDQLRDFKLIVTRRSPVASRPPSEFELAWRGRFYEVWRQRPDDGMALVQDLRLGSEGDRGAVAECSQVFGLAQLAGAGGELRAAPAGTAPWILNVSEASPLPAGWKAIDESTFSPLSSGRLEVPIDADPGPYRLWVGGEVYGGLTATVNDQPAGELRGVVNNGGGLEPMGVVELKGDGDRLSLEYSGRDWRPGSGFQGTWSPFPVGPVILEPLESAEAERPGETELRAPITVPVHRYRELCDKRWDWIEARMSSRGRI